MIQSLVKSAFQTGCFSVASEGLIYQVLLHKVYQSEDLQALNALYQAVKAGQIQREATGNLVQVS